MTISPITLPFSSLGRETTIALEGIYAAGEAILEVYKENFTTMLKAQQEPVTEADLRSNKILLAALAKTKIPVLSEEKHDSGKRLEHSTVWIVDPLDGTKEFIKRNDEFAVMVALVEDTIPILGIVYQPTSGLLYLARKGEGVFQKTESGWKKLFVSNFREISKARVVLSKSHLAEKDKQFINHIGINNSSQKGSAGLKVGLICAGEAEFYFNPSDKLKEWDTAAAYCMITEAGGEITDLFGNPLKYNQKDVFHRKGILVSNGVLHSFLVKKLQKFYALKDDSSALS